MSFCLAYGVELSDLQWKEDEDLLKTKRGQDYLSSSEYNKDDGFEFWDFWRNCFENEGEMKVTLPNGKVFCLNECEDGLLGCYWNLEDESEEARKVFNGWDKEGVRDALWTFLGEFLTMTRTEFDAVCKQLGTGYYIE